MGGKCCTFIQPKPSSRLHDNVVLARVPSNWSSTITSQRLTSINNCLQNHKPMQAFEVVHVLTNVHLVLP
jgi:hypothetical protein